jgi:hypothetical protein
VGAQEEAEVEVLESDENVVGKGGKGRLWKPAEDELQVHPFLLLLKYKRHKCIYIYIYMYIYIYICMYMNTYTDR